jgi:hypothetical protein
MNEWMNEVVMSHALWFESPKIDFINKKWYDLWFGNETVTVSKESLVKGRRETITYGMGWDGPDVVGRLPIFSFHYFDYEFIWIILFLSLCEITYPKT